LFSKEKTVAEEEFVCALSGIGAQEDELVEDDGEDADDLGELPVGWIKITVQRRAINPEWLEMQQARTAMGEMLKAQTAQVPEEHRGALLATLAWQNRATFAALEKSIPKYVTFDDEAYVKDPTANEEIATAWRAIADQLDLDVETGGAVVEEAEAADDKDKKK
jgi:hypothetical protein